jgi:DNA repair exonuclease SbcCD ATPase subunit
MHKLCLPVLTLALSAPLLVSAAEPPAATASASASVSAKVTVSDQDALNDDILATIDLPLAAAEAREAGVEEADLKEALDTSREAGLPASEATEVVAVEAEQTRTRGVKKGFGRWVRMQVAAGLRGTKLAAKIKERKTDTPEFDEKKATELREKLEKQRELNSQWRAKLRERQGELLAKGKQRVLLHAERNEKLKAKIAAGQGKNAENHDAIELRLRALDERISAAAEADKPALQAEKERLTKALGHNEKVGEKLDKAEDRAEKREEKLEKLEEKLEKRDEKREKLGDKKGPHEGHEGKGPKDKAAKPGTPAQ